MKYLGKLLRLIVVLGIASIIVGFLLVMTGVITGKGGLLDIGGFMMLVPIALALAVVIIFYTVLFFQDRMWEDIISFIKDGE